MRQRSKKACLPCHRRKRKCDGKLPCANCTEYEYQCEYNGLASKKPRLDEHARPSMEPHLSTAKSPESAGSRGQSTKKDSGTVLSAPQGFLEPFKSRYMRRDSSIAFPRSLGLELQSSHPPRLHSFAYHTGIRTEPDFAAHLHPKLATLLDLREVEVLVELFRLIVHPVFGFLDIDKLLSRCEAHWSGDLQGPTFEAVICGVISLGSLFSDLLSSVTEAVIVEHAKTLLEDSYLACFPDLQQVSAWILRTLYLRATTRPHVVWLSSCTAMHLAEAIGLHRSPEEVILATNTSQPPPQDPLGSRERTIQVAQSLNLMIAYDYGRSAVPIRSKRERISSLSPADFTPQFCDLVMLLPLDRPECTIGPGTPGLIAALDRISNGIAEHDFLILARAELVHCIYRRLRHYSHRLEHEQISQIIKVGKASLPAARRLIQLKQPWWNVLSTMFQFICVLLSLDTRESLQEVDESMRTLDEAAQQLDTHLANEAVQTARCLVDSSIEHKRRAISILESTKTSHTTIDASSTQLPVAENDWDLFLQPFGMLPFLDNDTGNSLPQI